MSKIIFPTLYPITKRKRSLIKMADVKTNGTEGPGYSHDQSLSEPLLIALGSCLGEKARLFLKIFSKYFDNCTVIL